MSEISRLLRQMAETTNDPADLAKRHYDSLTPTQQQAWNEQLRYREAVRVMRDDVRQAEHEVRDLIADGVSPNQARRQLRCHGFFVPGSGEWVKWLDATVEQHQARREYLLSLAAGVMRTAEMHQQAIDDILAAGVTTLADLEEDVA